ncbi:Amidase [Penicillium occitanis (nom. inval.)]|nr:Amidase [Penicillium occitanis (nom. inval.)]PCG91017.1 hypothetical protein PENOC_099370 [Penicillium occitanis (nom. inval.)]
MEITQKKRYIDVLTATAADLCRLLEAGQTTSVNIVEAYLAQIEKHNKTGLGLRAIISTAPRDTVLSRATKLDTERLNGKIRSGLHGIPIIIKDAIVTSKALGMPTTAGAFAFKETYGKKNAAIVKLLIQSGLIIIGKASMTEFCGLKATFGGFRKDDLFCGRSGPGGSSSGSGVGVSAGFAPLSIGTETGGSIYGLFSLSRSFDGLGGMAKTVEDLEMLMNLLLSDQAREAQSLKWEDISIGFVDPIVWNAFGFQNFPDEGVEKQILDGYEWARAQLAQRGAKIAYPVKLPLMKDLNYDGKSVSHLVSFFEFPRQFEKFCEELQNAEVSSVQELIEFNNKNAGRAMPEPHTDQADLIQTLESTMTDETASAVKAQGKLLAGSQGIDAALAKNEIDLIIGPGDCEICAVAALAGYPKAMVPMSRLEGPVGLGQPQGLMIIGGAGSERKMFEFMKLWKEVIGTWKVPPLLETADREKLG